MNLNTFLQAQHELMEVAGLRRVLRRVTGSQNVELNLDGRSVLNFCSNDYLGLADDSRLVAAASESLNTEGFGSGASRLVCGNMESHRNLEDALARFKGTEACLVFTSGYMANVGIITSLFGRSDTIFSDRLNHASIVDGIQLSGAKAHRYVHCDVVALERMLRDGSAGSGKRVIITDSVFSMDGDLAPLVQLADLASRYDCALMIDEAHALGVFGRGGKGLAEELGVEDRIDIQMGTLSKAAGAFGSYCCGSRSLIDFLISRARSFIYTTGMPPSVAAAGFRAIEIIRDDARRREILWRNTRYMKEQCGAMGWDTGKSQSAIIPLMVGDDKKAVDLSRRLLEKGIFVSAIRPPTVPAGTARLRLTVTAGHTTEQLDRALEVLRTAGEDLCLL